MSHQFPPDAIIWEYIDKRSWQPGPWQSEPDKVQWKDPLTGLSCLMVRGPLGAWCGYAGVTAEHALYGVECDAVRIPCERDVNFSGSCQANPLGVCHIPAPGEPDDVWWFGFSCDLFAIGDICPIPELDNIRGLMMGGGFCAKPAYRECEQVQEMVTVLAVILSVWHEIEAKARTYARRESYSP